VNNDYHFITRWRLKASADEVFEILSQSLEYERWWPSVYLMVQELAPGGRDGQGRRMRFLTRGWLPYKLRWEARTTESRRPSSIAIQATGDFEGRGIWSIVQDGDFVDASFDWKLAAEKPLLRRLSFAFRPAFEANHRWAMEQGRQSLELELARYRAHDVEEMNAIPEPAGPARFWGRTAAAGVVLSVALIAGLWKTHEPAPPQTLPSSRPL